MQGIDLAGPGVVAIIRLRSLRPSDELLGSLLDGGVRSLEVTLPTPGSLDAVARWRDLVGTGVEVGVGTVRDAEGARRAVEAGATFLVTPAVCTEVLTVARETAVPVICGALTPTEIERAYAEGATAVKVFPVGPVGGPAYIAALREPLPDIPLVPTGGVGADDARAYAALGCVGVGVGSSLVEEAVVEAGDWAVVADRARSLVTAWEEGHGGG
ncbi:MAG: bifunctional 4-hydroxy-2-oxoglutarate aldolase/2-dehydro-3-deoxy-phosphogluconate aldolase [Propionibacteriales bacterium]|nr:bifunctional 4-hydroxy-2-oxoglutarate aldolase/2-dehydro-3-deoxy-phosphogluconate aldolase [Propionibacteriales bacterium]